MRSRWLIVLLATGACQRSPAISAPTAARTEASAGLDACRLESPGADALQTPLQVCRGDPLNPLLAAREFYDDGLYAEALACAARASALSPTDPQAHSERGAALAALGQMEDAQLAYSRALALNPDHLDALLGAAYLYAVRLPSSRDRDELAAAYSERGLALAKLQHEEQMATAFALLSAMAFNDLGDSQRAFERAEQALQGDPSNGDARYERAMALFELCRFSEARRAFNALLNDPDHQAHANHQLGLLLEREGKFRLAEKHFAVARQLAPEDFPEVALPSPEAFRSELTKALAELPADMRRDLAGIPVTAEDIPADTDLLSTEPPLSPTILGLFRGPPLGEACTVNPDEPCRSVALYRRNLARTVRNKDELFRQIKLTLLHEIGHLRGEDDLELAARGLE
jgi:Flp pilus assembly protein TadD/predicted Zn-dependent protease with MMP-like domain